MFIFKKHLSRRTFLPGTRRGCRTAVPRCDGAGANPGSQHTGVAEGTLCLLSTCRTARRWTSGRRQPPVVASSSPRFSSRSSRSGSASTSISGLAHPYVAGAGGADVSAGANHTRAAAVFLTGAVPERGTAGTPGVSADQLAARHIGQDTPLPSLELSIEESVLACEAAFSCAYRNSISWKSPTDPLPMQNNPRLVFEKLFGDGNSTAERRSRRDRCRAACSIR